MPGEMCYHGVGDRWRGSREHLEAFVLAAATGQGQLKPSPGLTWCGGWGGLEFQGGRPNQPKGLRHRTFEKHPEPHESPKELRATKHVLLQGWLPGG